MATSANQSPRVSSKGLSRRILQGWLHHRLPVAASLLSVLLIALTTGSMPVSDAPSTDYPPVLYTEYEVEIPCQVAVYVDEQNPGANNNGAMQGDYLRVGTGPEFCGQLWSLLDIGPVMEGDGGPIPDDAEITEARLKVYKQSGPSDTVKAYGLKTSFNEGSVTWNNHPERYSSPTSNTTVPASNGWTYLNFPVFTLNDAISGGHGVRLALCPTWTGCSRSVVFFSDDHGYRPSLAITYLAAEGGTTPPTPEPSEDDTEPCDLDITWSPSHPSPGQMVTITATANDDVEMRYVAIYRGSIELARRDATSGQTSLSVSYTEEAVLPSLGYIVTAKDRSVATPQVLQAVTIPVVGTGTAPEVTMEIEWDIDEVIPERYRLIREDGQMATITATATDPEGIDYMEIHCSGLGGARRFEGDGDGSVSATVYWVNDDPGATTFSCYASAVDMEHNYSSTEAEHIDIVNPGGLLLMTTAAPGFHNPSNDRLSWTRMVQTFGDGECYWAPDWKSWYALIWYHAGFKGIADGGECFGMSTMATELYQSRIIANNIDSSVSMAAYMTYENSFTKEYVEARQGGQLGEEVAFTRYHQNYVGTLEKLGWIQDDLAANRPGVLSIREGDSGHAIVPWMSRHMPDGTTRIYVYDCNREGGIVQTRDNGPDNPDFDLHNFGHYPYVVFAGSNWSYLWGDGSTWNDKLAYFEYEEACGDMGQLNHLNGPFSPEVTDHDIPSIMQYLFAPIGGDVDVLIEDEDGNMTGIYEGDVVEDIPESMAMYPMMGKFSEHEMYLLPIDEDLTIHVKSKGDGEYVLGLLGGASLIAIEQKDLSEGAEDIFKVSRASDVLGHKLRVMPGMFDDSFNIIFGHMFDGYVEATMMDFIGRDWVLEGVSATEEGDFTVHVDESGGTLVVENHGDEDIEFDATMRSTESLDEVEGNLEDLPFIPASTAEEVRVGGGETLELTPEDWSTTEESGGLHILRNGKETTPQGSSFPLVPVLIGVAAAATVLGVLAWKGVIGKGKKS